MKNLEKLTGKTKNEIKVLYLSAIDMFIGFGATEKQARKLAKKAFKKAVIIMATRKRT